MRVRATDVGFYGTQRRNEGDEFELVDLQRPKHKKGTLKAKDQFSEKWMEKVKGKGDKPAKAPLMTEDQTPGHLLSPE